jgi:NAD(P)-dependent dehydrogenase (short-subunit alcohol dehydrogenase family)
MRTVVVTGASAGLGRAIAEAFGARGDRVALLARDRDRLDDAADSVRAAGGRALAIPTEVAEFADVEAAADLAEAELGPIDVWVNNAMVAVFGPFRGVAPDEFQRVTDVTYHGYVNGTRAALARMVPRNRGTIVQVGSALAYRGIPLQSAYCGSKHAIKGFTESVRCELLHDRSDVRITMVQMPALNTPQFDWGVNHMPCRPQPVPPIFEPEVGAAAVVLASEGRRREYWVAWPTARAVLGNRVLPGILDRLLAIVGEDRQQTSEPADPSAPTNLWKAVPGQHGAHGRFVDRSQRSSRAFELVRLRDKLAASTGLSSVADRLAWRIAAVLARATS